MKKHILTILCLLAGLTAAQAQHRADRLQLNNPESFTFVVFGDAQGYTKYDINQPIF